MNFKFKRKIVLPILLLMVMPTIILSVLFFNRTQKKSQDILVENIENLLETYQIKDDFYSKQMLFSELSSLKDVGIIAYESENIIYNSLDLINLDIEELNILDEGNKRYEIKRKVFDNFNLSIYIIIDRVKIYSNILTVNIPYLILIGISIFISLQCILLLMNSFFKPISILLDGYNDVISGNLKSNINVKREDELGLLGDAFNEMKNRIAIGSKEFLLMKRFNDDILRSISTGIITTDMNGKIKNYNDTASGIIERVMCLNEIKPEIVNILMMQVNETIEGLDCVNKVAPFKGYDIEETVYLDITTSLMKNSQGENIGVICNFNDITNRKRIEDNVERINRLTSLGELTAALAHEIRNPLSGIKMSAQILNKRLFSHLKASDQKLFEAIIKETERLNFLITDLLNFSKPRAPNFQSIDVSEILDRALIFSKEKIREKKALVKVKYNINEKNVYLDKSQLSQIFLNVISNALDAIDIKGSLIITVQNSDESEDKYICVTFEDDGCGIDEENISKIFDPFFTTRESGTGLGLSVVYKLVTSNNGNIKIESIKSIGTIVKIYLPKYKGDIDED